jgi:hypothetical protein
MKMAINKTLRKLSAIAIILAIIVLNYNSLPKNICI